MPALEFTQYLYPNGRKEKVCIDRPAEIESKYRALLSRGCYFECEVHPSTQKVWLTCEHPKRDGDIWNELVQNGPEVVEAVDRLIDKAWYEIFYRKILE